MAAEPKAEEDKDKDVKEEAKEVVDDDDDAAQEAEIQKKLEEIMGRKPKPLPGDDYAYDYTPDVIEFKWNKDMTNKRKCDTQHMLYVLQLALDKVRQRTNERNKYFGSINRADRYISHLNAPMIIANFLDWHNIDPEKNKFDGARVYKTGDLDLINEYIAKIGKAKLGPATKIVMKLKDVYIDRAWMELPQPRLKLKTVGYDRMNKGDKILAECTVEEVIALLTFVNPAAEQKGDDAEDEKTPQINGIFAIMQQEGAKKKKQPPILAVENWKELVMAYFRKESVNGKVLMDSDVKELTQLVMNAIIPPDVLNEKKKPKNNILRGGVKSMLNSIKTCDVTLTLAAAQKQ